MRGPGTLVLGIESTAHTFGVAVASDKEPHILSDERHKYVPEKGGIHPLEASLSFMKHAPTVIRKALEEAGVTPRELDGVAAAFGPGLGPCLRVGATAARALAAYYHKPLLRVNHAVAHVEIGRLLTGARDPVIVYLSGGNTLIAAQVGRRYRVFGETLDVALGNFMDHFTREAGLAPPYVVGGLHQLDRCAEGGKLIPGFPYIVKGQDVSFSGLLTHALRALKAGHRLEDVCYTVREIAYSAIIEITERALAHTGKNEVLLVGGVAASPVLRKKFEVMAAERGATVKVVPPKYAVDNGAMIAWTGVLMLRHGMITPPEKAYVRQRWRIDEFELPWFT